MPGSQRDPPRTYHAACVLLQWTAALTLLGVCGFSHGVRLQEASRQLFDAALPSIAHARTPPFSLESGKQRLSKTSAAECKSTGGCPRTLHLPSFLTFDLIKVRHRRTSPPAAPSPLACVRQLSLLKGQPQCQCALAGRFSAGSPAPPPTALWSALTSPPPLLQKRSSPQKNAEHRACKGSGA